MTLNRSFKRIIMLITLFVSLFSLSACGSDYSMATTSMGGSSTITITVKKTMEIEEWTFSGTSVNATISKNGTTIEWHTSTTGATSFYFDLGTTTLKKGDLIVVMALNCSNISNNLVKA